MKVERYLRMGAIVLSAGTGWFSYAVVSQSSHRIMTYFAFELSQNLYFVGLVLTYVLWAAVLKMRQTQALLVQLVLSLGIYFSACAASYSLSNLHPHLLRVRVLPGFRSSDACCRCRGRTRSGAFRKKRDCPPRALLWRCPDDGRNHIWFARWRSSCSFSCRIAGR